MNYFYEEKLTGARAAPAGGGRRHGCRRGAASVAAMLGARARVGQARVTVSFGAFAWGDGHETARELVGWGSGGSGGRRRRGNGGAGTGTRGLGLIRTTGGEVTGVWRQRRGPRALSTWCQEVGSRNLRSHT